MARSLHLSDPMAFSLHRYFSTCFSKHSFFRLTGLGIIAGILFLVSLSAHAQSPSNFEAAPTVTTAKAEPATPKAQTPAPPSTIPSRNILQTDLEAYFKSFTTTFAIQSRDTDPFGRSQDPDAKPIIVASTNKTVRRPVAVQATPLSEVVRLVSITTIMPGEKRFLIGSRSISEGQTLPLRFRGKLLRVAVTGINPQEITFKNLDSGETASRTLDILPAGMIPGSHGIDAPGMVRDRPDAPIDLEAADPLMENSQNH